MVSTEDQEIAELSRRLGADVPFLRPADLASDDAPMIDVVTHALRTLDVEGYRADVVVLLQPTSPFRRAEHVDGVVDLLLASSADSVVTVVQVPHQFTPGSLLQLRGDCLEPWTAGPAITRRQDKPILFARNGPAIVATHSRVVLSQQTLYGPDTRGFVMSREDSLDIDDQLDLRVAELLLASRPV